MVGLRRLHARVNGDQGQLDAFKSGKLKDERIRINMRVPLFKQLIVTFRNSCSFGILSACMRFISGSIELQDHNTCGC